MIDKGKRGRPLGHILSVESKLAISEAKLGSRHSELTKNKISKSLTNFYKNKFPLSDELLKLYGNKFNKEAKEWIESHIDEIDNFDNVYTDRNLSNFRRREFEFTSDYGYNSYVINNDKLLDLKKVLIDMRIDISKGRIVDIISLLIEEMGLNELLGNIANIFDDTGN